MLWIDFACLLVLLKLGKVGFCWSSLRIPTEDCCHKMLRGLAPFLASCTLTITSVCVEVGGECQPHHRVWIPTRWHALCHAPLFNVSLCEVSYVQMRDLRPTRMPELPKVTRFLELWSHLQTESLSIFCSAALPSRLPPQLNDSLPSFLPCFLRPFLRFFFIFLSPTI